MVFKTHQDTWTHSVWDSMYEPMQDPSSKVPSMNGESGHRVSLLAEEIFVMDGCWEREFSVFFKDMAIERLPMLQ